MGNVYSVSFDSIVFGLQEIGGISNYWSKLLNSYSHDSDILGKLILPQHVAYRDFDNNWLRRMDVLRETLDPRIGRYLPVSKGGGSNVFHTSYYRLPFYKSQKYIVTVYDFTYERYRSGLARFIHSKQKFASIRSADAIICISESTRRDVIEFCPEIKPSKIHVIHLGVDRSDFYPDLMDASNEYKKTVLFVGRRDGYKRFELAVDAIRQLPDLSLGIVGPLLSTYERELLNIRLGSRWLEFGPVSNKYLRQLYSSAFAFIFPSDYEGFGLPVLEAMACGCPVVTSSLSSLPEVGGDVAYYADIQTGDSYANALKNLFFADVRKNVISRGIQRASEFDWLRTLQLTKSIYLS